MVKFGITAIKKTLIANAEEEGYEWIVLRYKRNGDIVIREMSEGFKQGV